jgi:hypothetical protein
MQNKEETNHTESSPDGAEPVNRVKPIIDHPDEKQLNPEDFRIDQSELDQPVTKTILTNLSVRGPETLEFIRVHRGKDYRMGPIPFIALKQSKEFYVVDPALRSQLRTREYWIGTVFLATNRLEKPFLWIVTTQSPTGRISDWYTSKLECAERAMEDWVQVVADQEAGVYQVCLADERLEEPVWPKQSFQELFHMGFKRRWVSSLDHPIFKQLRGRA